MSSAFLCGSGTSRGFITSDGSIMLKLKGEANTAVLYDAKYDTQRPTLPFV